MYNDEHEHLYNMIIIDKNKNYKVSMKGGCTGLIGLNTYTTKRIDNCITNTWMLKSFALWYVILYKFEDPSIIFEMQCFISKE